MPRPRYPRHATVLKKKKKKKKEEEEENEEEEGRRVSTSQFPKLEGRKKQNLYLGGFGEMTGSKFSPRLSRKIFLPPSPCEFAQCGAACIVCFFVPLCVCVRPDKQTDSVYQKKSNYVVIFFFYKMHADKKTNGFYHIFFTYMCLFLSMWLVCVTHGISARPPKHRWWASLSLSLSLSPPLPPHSRGRQRKKKKKGEKWASSQSLSLLSIALREKSCGERGGRVSPTLLLPPALRSKDGISSFCSEM